MIARPHRREPISGSATSKQSKTRQPVPGLERSCKGDWVRMSPWQHGIQRIEAFFSGEAYAPHRHDTYSIGYTMRGVQRFDYRGERTDSTPGRIMVLHPDEVHNGEAGTEEGFHYRMVYIDPYLVRQALGTSASTLPFVKDAVFNDPRILDAIHTAFFDMDMPLESVALDELLVLLADGLLAYDNSAKRRVDRLIDPRATELARAYLDANTDRTVSSEELEACTGQDRYTLSRHFRKAFGTSPYRYLVQRRLDRVRAEIASGLSLTEAALVAGFCDQPHMNRRFKAAFGISPGKWQRLLQNAM